MPRMPGKTNTDDPRERRRKRLEEKNARKAAKKKAVADRGVGRMDKLAASDDCGGLWFQQMQLKFFEDTVCYLGHMQGGLALRCKNHAMSVR
jgi:hypothetical protein